MRSQQGSKCLIALEAAQEQAKDCKHPRPSFLIGSCDAGFELWAGCKPARESDFGSTYASFRDSILSYITVSATLFADVKVFQRLPGPSCSDITSQPSLPRATSSSLRSDKIHVYF